MSGRTKAAVKKNGKAPPHAAPLAIEYVAPDALTPAAYNPRTMPDAARRKLERSVKEFGLVDPIVARRSDRLVIGGHQRLDVARALGLASVPVVFLDGVDDRRAAALNVALNNSELAGEWDLPKLADLVLDLDAHGFDATLTGFDTDRIAEWATWTGNGHGREEAPDVDLTPPERPKSKRGEVYELGPHRLLCGDATDSTDVVRLLDGTTPTLMVTDPPYGVDYDPEWRNEAAAKGLIAFAAGREGKVANDDRADWADAWRLFGGDVAYCWHADRHASIVQASLESAGFEVRAQIVWAKPRFVISRGHYHWQHEPCWYAVRRGASASWVGNRSQTTLWEIPLRDDVDQKGHSAQKPTECMERPVRNHTGDVYDPFAGTGTTTIAAERQGRRAYLLEIDPAYCDVIRRRYAQFVGRPELAP